MTKEILIAQLVERGGISYEVNSTTPFSGLTLDYHENGQLEYRGKYKDGILDGLYETLYDNGQLKERGNFKNGEYDGLWEYYHENGQLEGRRNYKDSKEDGLWEVFRENGQLEYRGKYKNGKQIGIHEYFDREGQLETADDFTKPSTLADDLFVYFFIGIAIAISVGFGVFVMWVLTKLMGENPLKWFIFPAVFTPLMLIDAFGEKYEIQEDIVYAGLGDRFGANIIDGMITVVIACIPFFIFFSLDDLLADPRIFGVFVFPIRYLYIACFHSSKYQATPGLMAGGIKIYTAKLERVDFTRAIGRLFVAEISSLLFFVGHFMIAWTKRKQGVHDYAAHTIHLKSK